ncbi:MAG: hypothetical protein GY847_19865 [Proteobacteria bacterium]|nr:hypothetical protein [Pseudomonadota bacterium]
MRALIVPLMVLIYLFAWPTDVRAQAKTTDVRTEIQKKSERVVVMIVPADQEAASLPVIRAVQSQLSDIDVIFRLQPVETLGADLASQISTAEAMAREWSSIAVFWCDFAGEEQIFLYLTEYEGDRILVRKLREKEDGGRAEALAIIVRTSVNEMLQGGEIGIRAAAVVKKEPPPPPPVAQPAAREEEPPTDEGPHVRFGVAYTLYTYSSKHPAMHGLDLGFELLLHPSWALSAGYTIYAPVDEKGDSSSIMLRRHPGRLGVSLKFPLGIAEIGASLFFALDVMTFHNYEMLDVLKPVSDRNDVVFHVLPTVDAAIEIIKRLSGFISVGLDVPINDKYYVVEIDKDHEVLLRPWSIHLNIYAGFRFEII